MAVDNDKIKFSDLYTIITGTTHTAESVSLSDFRGEGTVPTGVNDLIGIGLHFKGKTFSSGEGSLIEILENLASKLNNLNNNDIQSKINDAGFTIFAKIKSSYFAENLQGMAVSSFPHTFADNVFKFAYNTAKGNTLGSGENLVKQTIGEDVTEERHFMAMAIYSNSIDGQNGNFEGILVWTFTGSDSGGKKRNGTNKTITNIASLFINVGFNSNNDFWSVYPYFIPRTGNIVTGTESGWRFSNGQNATSNGYNSTSTFASDDGAWAIQFGSNVEGNSPGPYLGSDSSSYGIINPNSGDANFQCRIAGSQKNDFKAYVFYSSQMLGLLYAFTSHTFTNCGATGQNGPTLANCTSSYSSASWTSNTDYFNMTTTGIQEWTVPDSGTYKIEAWGASGGNDKNGLQHGFGAKIIGTFLLTKGEKYMILVGQKGLQGDYACGAGGGGSFVVKGTIHTSVVAPDILIIAGGGGGAGRSNTSQEINGRTGRDGGYSYNESNGKIVGGTDGGGGGADTGGDGSAGGGGFLQDGDRSYGSDAYKGKSFKNGGQGGTGASSGDGGFGGGGGAHGNWTGGGGGGGFSGGAGGSNYSAATTWSGGGGGSYNSGASQQNAGFNDGEGKVEITLL